MIPNIHQIEVLKRVNNCHSHEEFLQISETEILQCIREHFYGCSIDDLHDIDIKDANFYTALKNVAESYLNFMTMFHLVSRGGGALVNGCVSSTQMILKPEQLDLECRKNTRATFAMRNSKNQQQLKKDQIFVRVIPRTHNCIHFMVKNHNFPRIQCRLSCNQHLEYLVNYLTNKWLRGKVGVGYQIKLFPDPSTYMHKHSNETKRPNVIHEPLNNYLMFTDIMAAFGVGQNGCINLLYDITEMRKQKQKQKILYEKQSVLSNQNRELKQIKNSIGQNEGIEKSLEVIPQNVFKKDIGLYEKQGKFVKESKGENNAHMKHEIDHHQEQLSIGLARERKNYGGGHNSVDYSEVNSIGYQFNSFNSNNIINTLLNINNSNTFLNAINNMESQKNQIEHGSSLSANESKNIIKPMITMMKSPVGGTAATPAIGAPPENKLERIRNYISIVEKQAGGGYHEAIQQIMEKDENSLHKSQKIVKKEVKTVTVIKKKNQNQ